MLIQPPGPIPQDALNYFRNKALKPAFSWEDVWREEHAAQFTVAKAMQLDVLRTIREALDASLAEGKTFRQFQKELEPQLQKLGWWGIQEVTDPRTGERVQAELGSPRRLRIIYDANLRAARAAGQWARIQRSKEQFPYLLYQLGPSREHRLQHVAWHGLLLPVDDPFWQTAMPPNGWGCKCRVRAVTRREYERLQQSGIPSRDPENPGKIPVRLNAPAFQMVEHVNKRTGEVLAVPRGIDPGWDYNPGQAGRVGALEAERVQKREQTEAVLGQPVSERVWSDDKAVFSTVKGVNQADIERVLSEIPGAGEQIEALARFLNAHPAKALLLKQTEMSRGTQAAGKLEKDIREFLSAQGFALQWLYTMRRVKTLNGFTSSAFDHVITKVKSSDRLTKADPQKLAQAVEQLLEHAQQNQPVWSVRAMVDQLSDDSIGIIATLIHEIAHQVHFWAGAGKPPAQAPAATRYSAHNAYEWHAEHLTMWFFNRAALLRWNREVVLYLDDLIEHAINRSRKSQ